MRRLWVVVVFALGLMAMGVAPVASAEPDERACDKSVLAGDLAGGRIRTRQVSPVRAVSPLPCDGVRPGGAIKIPKGDESSLCTLNFMYIGMDPKGGKHVYMGTAGHCLLAESNIDKDRGEHRWAPGKGPVVTDVNDKRIGEFAYAIMQGKKDFALVRIDYGVRVNPQMCWFGGPTGINNDRTRASTNVHHYGHGLAIGDVLPARTSVAYGIPDPDEVDALGVVIPGDSGGPSITSDGRALGVVITIGVTFRADPLGGGTVGISRIQPQLNRAALVLKQRITIVKAPLI